MSSAITVRISSGRSYCSGVLISPGLQAAAHTRTDLVLSCAHFLRGRTGPIKVGRAQVLGAVRIPHTDLAVLRLDTPAAPADLLRLSTSPAPWLSPTRTEGFGGGARRVQQRHGRVIAHLPLALGRNLRTLVTAAAILHNRPKAIKGDSGGPVIVDGEIVAVQSLISDPLGHNLGIATVAQVAAHRGKIAAAVTALQRAY